MIILRLFHCRPIGVFVLCYAGMGASRGQFNRLHVQPSSLLSFLLLISFFLFSFFFCYFPFFFFFYSGGETIPVLPGCMPVPEFRLVGESGKGPRPQGAGCIERTIWEVNRSVPEGSCKARQGRESGQYNGRPTGFAAGVRPLPPLSQLHAQSRSVRHCRLLM
ncbi:hypothetical protein BDW75DRAFT_109046 [Aspergillus navahoensis]